MNSCLKTLSYLFGLVVLTISCGQKELRDKPFNVLFIAVDDLRPELGCYGKDYMYTPNIDKLAKEARVFNKAFCQQAICGPSRASILSGIYPHESGVMDFETSFRNKFPDLKTLPQLFKNNGYHAYGVGKIYHHPTGFDTLSWSEKQPQLKGDVYMKPENKDRYSSSNEIVEDSEANYIDRNTTMMAIEKLKELKDSVFFLAVGLYKPHLPYNAPKKFWDLYDRSEIELPVTTRPPVGSPSYSIKGYWELVNYADIPPQNEISEDKVKELIHGYRASVSYSDYHVGLLLDALHELDLSDNTVVVLWGDHGYKLYDYGDWCKHTLSEVDNHVPLIVKVPGMNQPGDPSDALVELVDVYPTLAELCGVSLANSVSGKSFKNVINNPITSHHTEVLSVYKRGWAKVFGYSIRNEDFRFIKWQGTDDQTGVDSLELYDLQKDPLSTINLAYDPQYREDVVKLLDRLDERLVESTSDLHQLEN